MGYYSNLIAGNISQQVTVDSVTINTDQYPFILPAKQSKDSESNKHCNKKPCYRRLPAQCFSDNNAWIFNRALEDY